MTKKSVKVEGGIEQQLSDFTSMVGAERLGTPFSEIQMKVRASTGKSYLAGASSALNSSKINTDRKAADSNLTSP
jgi:hypothetical protein